MTSSFVCEPSAPDHFSLHHLLSIPYIHPMPGLCIEATALEVEESIRNLTLLDDSRLNVRIDSRLLEITYCKDALTVLVASLEITKVTIEEDFEV